MTVCNPGASRETLNNGYCTPGNRGEVDRGKAEERAVAPLRPSLSPEKSVTAGREAACPNQRLPRYRVPFAVEELPFDEAVALAADTGTISGDAGPLLETVIDMLDELGILLTYELSYPETMIQDPARVDLISVKGYDGACDRSGKLLPGFVDRVKYRIRTTYSHPVICTYSFGNELCSGYDDPRMINMLNNLYDLYAKTDKQRRPVTNSSGRAAPELIADILSGKEKAGPSAEAKSLCLTEIKYV